MAPPFLKMTRTEFEAAVRGFTWRPRKTEIHVHHTWRPNHSQYQGERSIIGMWEFHTRTNGWSDIAQHVSIAPDGTIWSGRDWNKTPASAAGNNHSGVFMFETIGDFDTDKDPLTSEQLESVLYVTALLSKLFGIGNDKIKFHNQMSTKTCPGTSVNKDAFLRQVAERRAGIEEQATEAAPPPLARELSEELNRRTAEEAETEGPTEDLGGAEHSQDKALEDFMRNFHENVYRRSPSAALDTQEESLEATRAAPARQESAAQEALALSQEDDEALFRELGQRAYKLEALPESALSRGLQHDDAEALEGLWDQFATLGRRIFRRVTRELHGLLCGDSGDDASDRAKLRDAFKLGRDDIVTAIVGVLVSTFGLATPVATVIAALVAKRLLKPAYEETCQFWAEQLA